MAKSKKDSDTVETNDAKSQRPPAEVLYADELARLAAEDKGPRPPGWNLSLHSVRKFIIGDDKLEGMGSELLQSR